MTPDQAEKARAIEDWLISGMARSRIPAYAAQEGWDIDAGALIDHAERNIISDAERELPGATYAEALSLARLRNQLAAAGREGDIAAALGVTRQIDRLTSRAVERSVPRPQALPQADAARLLMQVGAELAEVRRPRRKALPVTPVAEVRTHAEDQPPAAEPVRVRRTRAVGSRR